MGFLRLFGKSKEHSQTALLIGDLSLLHLPDCPDSPSSFSQHVPPALESTRSQPRPATQQAGGSARRRSSLVTWIKKYSGQVNEPHTQELQKSPQGIKQQIAQSFKDELNFEQIGFVTDEELTKERLMSRIKSLFKSASSSIILLYYVGAADECGNWKVGETKPGAAVGLDQLLVFRELSGIWQKYRKHSQHLVLLLDCPNSGCWVDSLKSLSRAEQIELSICIQASDSGPNYETKTNGSTFALQLTHPPGTFTPLFFQNNWRQRSSMRPYWPQGMNPTYYSSWLCTTLLDFGLPLFFFAPDQLVSEDPQAVAAAAAHAGSLRRHSAAPESADPTTGGQASSPNSRPRPHSHARELSPQLIHLETDGISEEPQTSTSESMYAARPFLSPKHASSNSASIPTRVNLSSLQHDFTTTEMATLDLPIHARSLTSGDGAKRSSFDSKLVSLLLEEKKRQQRKDRALDGEENLDQILDDDVMLAFASQTNSVDLLKEQKAAENLEGGSPDSSTLTLISMSMDNCIYSLATRSAPNNVQGYARAPSMVDIASSRLSRMTSSSITARPPSLQGVESERGSRTSEYVSDCSSERGSAPTAPPSRFQATYVNALEPVPSSSPDATSSASPSSTTPERYTTHDHVVGAALSSPLRLSVSRPTEWSPASFTNPMMRHILRTPQPGGMDSEPPSPNVLRSGRGGLGRLEIGGSETSSFLFCDDEERYKMLQEMDEMGKSIEAMDAPQSMECESEAGEKLPLPHESMEGKKGALRFFA